MNVLVFKVPVSVELVPDHQGYLEMRHYGSERKPYVDLDPVAPMLLDTVKLEHWPIRKFSKYHCDPSERGMPIERQNRRQIDTYIAVDPELEKFLAIEYNQKIDEAYRLLNVEKTSRMQREIEIDNWWAMPWYKRVWSALRG